MKIRIDMDLCQGHGACAVEAPEVFALDGDGRVVLRDENPDESLRAAVRNAVKYCPTRALRLADA